MKKTLVVYYSFDESTSALAQAMADSVDGDILRLVPVGTFDRTYYHHVENREQIGASPGYDESREHIWGSESVKMNDNPELEPYNLDLSKYELVILGTPVWALTYAPPLRTFLNQTVPKGKQVAIFCTHDGMLGATFENLKKALAGNEIIEEIDFESPASRLEEYVKTASSWARDLARE